MPPSKVKRVLVLIASDPRSSGRPAEAMRVAAGLSAWGRLEVCVGLVGRAVLALDARAAEWVDGEHFGQYLPGLAARAEMLAVRPVPPLATLAPLPCPVREVQEPELAAALTRSDIVLRF